MTGEFELKPFRYDNLLAFLALLGFVRALDHARPDWRVRAWWRRRGNRGPWVPAISVEAKVDREELLEAAITGLRKLGRPLAELAVQLASGTDGLQLAASLAEAGFAAKDRLSALKGLGGIEIATGKATEMRFRLTPFLPKRKAGRQDFLGRIARLTCGLDDPPTPGRRRRPARRPTFRELLEECLFKTWHPRPAPEGFRWDPLECRRYAYRFSDPSTEPAQVVIPAVRFAVLALPWFPLVPRRDGARAPCFVEISQRHLLRWPIWTVPARPCALRALLAHPAFVRSEPPSRTELVPLGVGEVMTARVVWLGNPANGYPNFTRGEPLWGTL